MKAARIENGSVVDLWDVPALDCFAGISLIPAPVEVSIGWGYAGGNFVAPPAQPQPVPKEVTMRQARLALLGAGMLPGVTAAIAALPSPQKEAAQIEWEYSQVVERHRGLVLSLGTTLGLTSLQLDGLFTTAATL